MTALSLGYLQNGCEWVRPDDRSKTIAKAQRTSNGRLYTAEISRNVHIVGL